MTVYVAKECIKSASGALFLRLLLIMQAKQPTSKPASGDSPACFAAGTLVHAEHGPVPIESLKIGDLVYTKAAPGAEKVLRKVTNTFVRYNKILWHVGVAAFFKIEPSVQEPADTGFDSLVVTADHPFWIKNYGWCPVDEIVYGEQVDTNRDDLDGGIVTMLYPILRHESGPNIGWTGNFTANSPMEARGYLIDFDNEPPKVINKQAGPNSKYFRKLGLPCDWERDAYRADVYNIEVEEFHSYFVGTLGIWVHAADYSSNPPHVVGENG